MLELVSDPNKMHLKFYKIALTFKDIEGKKQE